MRRTEIISETMAAGTQAAEAKAGKGRLSGAKKAVTAFCGAAYFAVNGLPMTVFATGGGTGAITQPLDNLKTLVIAVIGAVGVIILAKNVMEFAQAYQQQDSSTMNSALKGISGCKYRLSMQPEERTACAFFRNAKVCTDMRKR